MTSTGGEIFVLAGTVMGIGSGILSSPSVEYETSPFYHEKLPRFSGELSY